MIVEIAGCFIPRDIFTAITYLKFTLSSLVKTVIYGIMNMKRPSKGLQVLVGKTTTK